MTMPTVPVDLTAEQLELLLETAGSRLRTLELMAEEGVRADRAMSTRAALRDLERSLRASLRVLRPSSSPYRVSAAR